MNRLEHLKQTIFSNIHHLKEVGAPWEIVILNYGDTDDLNTFIQTNPILRYEIHKQRVIYVKVSSRFYKEAHSKNIAHMCSTGDKVVNLDADNFLTKDYITTVNQFTLGTFLSTRIKTGGAAGRIAFFRKDFIALGGYDELRPNNVSRCFIDSDLKIRACFLPLVPVIYDYRKVPVLDHDNKIRNQNYETQRQRYTDQDIEDPYGPIRTYRRLFTSYDKPLEIDYDKRNDSLARYGRDVQLLEHEDGEGGGGCGGRNRYQHPVTNTEFKAVDVIRYPNIPLSYRGVL